MAITANRRRRADSPTPPARPSARLQAQAPIQLNTVTRTLDVKGKSATVHFGVVAEQRGLSGLFLDPGQRFTVDLVNRLPEDTIVHWHGQTPPVAQDGVTITGQEKVIGAGTTRSYDYAPRPGTYWMHSHEGMQEMQLLAGPLIVRTADEVKQDAQEVTVMLHDFTFKSPGQVMQEVAGAMAGMTGMGARHGIRAAGNPCRRCRWAATSRTSTISTTTPIWRTTARWMTRWWCEPSGAGASGYA